MANILLRFPTAGAPTTTITLQPSLVVIQWARISPIQHRQVAISGKEFIYQVHTNREQIIELSFEDLPQVDAGGFSGLLTYQSFHESTINYSEKTFDLTDADGDTTTVRYWEGIETLREAEGASRLSETWRGRILYRKTL